MKIWKITGLGVIFLLLIAAFSLIIGFSSHQPGSFFNENHNAVWIGHKWVGENMSDGEIQVLVNDLRAHGIDTVFVHSGPIEKKGVVDPMTYQYAVEFLNKAHKYGPEIEYQAWLGQIRSKIDLSDANVRHNIAKLSMTLTELIGFDGVHLNIEPVWDGDLDFIETLKEIREMIPDDKKISVALTDMIPGSVIWFLENVRSFENYNTEVNYQNVARYADQVVVMAYETSVSHEWFYRWLVKEQTIWVTDLLDDAEVFIGIPSYSYTDEERINGDGVGFDENIENMENGLRGVISGLNNFRSDEKNFTGVAVYSYWETDENEWGIYDELWGK